MFGGPCLCYLLGRQELHSTLPAPSFQGGYAKNKPLGRGPAEHSCVGIVVEKSPGGGAANLHSKGLRITSEFLEVLIMTPLEDSPSRSRWPPSPGMTPSWLSPVAHVDSVALMLM